MGRIIGIDLGTTNTAVAVLEGGRPRTIEDERGYKVLPSVVSAKGEGRFVVGQAAASLILTRPDRTVYATKRLIGRRFDAPEVQRVKDRVQFQVREGPDGGVQVQVGDAWMSPQEIAAVVLQVARGIAERALGEPVEEAVITVPAHFNHAQRAATLEAAQLAGLRCERLLNEPTAAALAYGHRRNVDRTLVIFDLGGGTFDVSVLRLRDGIYEILATSGDTFLGGEDFDYRVVDHLADGFAAKNGIDLRKDKNALQRLKDAAERAKCELSFSDRANVVVPHAAQGKSIETVITRQEIERMTGDLVDKCVAIARDAVATAGLAMTEVDDVILVGGQTRMPRVREAVAALFGREPSRTVHPEEAVAIGAAVHAANLEDVDGPRPVLLDVAPFDLGIDAVGGLFSVVIPKNARVPCSESKVFATANDNQESVRITVRQGESRIAADNEFLGEFVFDGLPPAPKMETRVSVTFRVDHNGMLHVSASDPNTGARRNITIRNYAEHARSPDVAPQVEGETERVPLSVAAPAAAASPTRDAAPPAAPTKGTAKKMGLLDAILGRKTPKAAAKPAAAPPPPVEEEAPAKAPPPVVESPAVPPPSARPGPFDDEEEPIAADGLVELDELAVVAPIEEDDLYAEPAASFGLAGAHQVGAASRDPFADEALEGLDAGDLFGDLVGDVAAPEEESGDVATDHGARVPTPPPPPAPGVHTLEEEEDFGLPDDLSTLFPEDDADVPTPASMPTAAHARTVTAPLPRPPDDLLDDLFGDIVDEGSLSLPVDEAAADDEVGGFAPADEAPDAAPAEADASAAGGGFALLEEPPAEGAGFALLEEPPPSPAPARRLDEEHDAFAMPDESGFSDGEFRVPDDLFADVDPAALDDSGGATFAMPAAAPEPAAASPKKAKKPARIRLQYREWGAFEVEYRENLRRNGSFIHTDKPLPVGRACVFEVGVPGLAEPLVFDAVVDAVSDGRNGTEAGMRVAWRMDGATRTRLEQALAGSR